MNAPRLRRPAIECDYEHMNTEEAARKSIELNEEDLLPTPRPFVEIGEEDLLPSANPAFELSASDLDELPSISFSLQDLQFPTWEVSSQELERVERHWLEMRKGFTFDLNARPLSYHGTPEPRIADSILSKGWKVGPGNAIGSGIYFAFRPDTKAAKQRIPVSGASFLSKTIADSYARRVGCLIGAEVDWGRIANWESAKTQKEFNAWRRESRLPGNQGDQITEWGITTGYHSVRCPKSGYGVMLHHQYQRTRKYWKTDRIKIRFIYHLNSRKLQEFPD